MSYKKDKWDELEKLRDQLSFLHDCRLDPPRYEERLSILNRILELDPQDKHSWMFKGDVLFELAREGFYDKLDADRKNLAYESLQSHENALEIDSDFIWALLGKGNTLMLLSKFEGAIRCYDKIMEMDEIKEMDEPVDIVWFNKGLALQNLKKYDEALKCYDIFFSLEEENKTDPELLYRKYQTLIMLGRKKEAIACYKLAFDSEPIDFSSRDWTKYVYYLGLGVFFAICFGIRHAL